MTSNLKPPVIHWFRQDLRLHDNPALFAAAASGEVLPVFILDDENAAECAHGSASRWWLHHSLQALNMALKGKLQFYRGDARKILSQICAEHNIDTVVWNRCYEPWRIARDRDIKATLQAANITVNTYNGSLLWEPWEALKKDGTAYKVFTPYYRNACREAPIPAAPLPAPADLRLSSIAESKHPLSALNLLPNHSWPKKLESHWSIGEAGAHSTLKDFISDGLSHYKTGRDIPALNSVSRLSPYLHWGEISVRQVWHDIQNQMPSENTEHFKRELAWREFSYSLLYYFPELPTKNLQEKFDHFPWWGEKENLQHWQSGTTGYPIVDAGMRELWQTGYMHNRVRMIVGSFLVKNLLLHWLHGERWFWDCLVDADLANNSASWQWIAGCGADAAPYFRIFNPVTQGEKFDPKGDYTRRFLPELSDLEDKYLHKPWEAPEQVLSQAGITLGKDYPRPIVDLKRSRERALEAYQATKAAPHTLT